MNVRILTSLLLFIFIVILSQVWADSPDEEAPVGGQLTGSNGFASAEQFLSDQTEFEDVETPATGLGPIFNGASCAECHNNPIIGGGSTATELRSSRFGGALIHTRALHPAIQEHVLSSDDKTGLRLSLPLLGDGFIECVDSKDLQATIFSQPSGMKGTARSVSVLEASGVTRTGRFGWKAQHASLQSFAADAYVNEMGITSPLLPKETLSNGRDTSRFDKVADPEDKNGENVAQFTRFMRSLNVPTPDAKLMATAEAGQGAKLFREIGCVICHVEHFTTLKTGEKINGGTFTVPSALGGTTFFPYSDFLLHDVGTGDGVQDPDTFRTPPLWGSRFKNRFMHDGLSFTRDSAIRRHNGQAKDVIEKYKGLPQKQQESLLTFLRAI